MANNVVASAGIAEIYSVHVLARELDAWTDRQARPSEQSAALPLLRVEECEPYVARSTKTMWHLRSTRPGINHQGEVSLMK